MDIITMDYETFYGDGYTLSSSDSTTESYVRDPRFEAILCSFKINGGRSWWVPRDDLPKQFAELKLHKHAVLMHHAHFDALILNHHYGIRPKLILDTLGMARALHGANGRLALAKLAERYEIGVKGTEVLNARGKRFEDFTPQELARYGEYSCNDSDLTYELGKRMLPQFSKEELQINDHIIRMFTEPVLRMDVALLEKYAADIRASKTTIMMQAGVQLADLMSNDKFAVVLRELGIDPPMKVSPAWLKKSDEERLAATEKNPDNNGIVYAFAKTDPGMQALQEHPDERVQVLVEARLQNKTTLAEKGALRLIGMAGRGPATVYLKYSGASGTHRLSGGDKFNWQSMKRDSDLRNATMAEDGSAVVVGDSSNIEARILDWLAGQDDMVQVYIDADNGVGPDMYCVIAERIYKRPITKPDKKAGIKGDPQERQMGKTAKLGLGFGLGHERFVLGVRSQAKDENGKPLIITTEFSKKVVDIYRSAHPQVQKLWKRGTSALEAIARGQVGLDVDYRGIVKTCKDGLIMPGGLRILFPDLKFEKGKGQFGGEWTFWNGKAREHIYGAKLIENCLAEGTEVLTDRGWVPIESVQKDDRVHDGVEFVLHGGTILKSIQECVEIDGVWMTPDHEVLTDEGWKTALEKPRPYRPDIRHDDRVAAYGERREKNAVGIPLRLWANNSEEGDGRHPRANPRGNPKVRLSDKAANRSGQYPTWDVQTPRLLGVAQYVRPMQAAYTSGIQKLWRAGHRGMQALAGVVRELLGRHGSYIRAWAYAGAETQRQGVHPVELRVGNVRGAGAQSPRQPRGRPSGIGQSDRHSAVNAVLPICAGPSARPVYDILNAGPRHRFVVRGKEGPIVVHNCIQCLARIIVFEQSRITAKELATIAKWVHSVHDEAVFVTETFYAPYVRDRLLGNMRVPPAWCSSLPLNSEGGFNQRYGLAK